MACEEMRERGKIWMWCKKHNFSVERFSFEREESWASWKTELIGVVRKGRERVVKKESIVLYKKSLFESLICYLSCLIIYCLITIIVI